MALFKKDIRVEDLPAELQATIAAAKQEQASIEALLKRATEAATMAGQVDKAVRDVAQQVSAVQARIQEFEKGGSALDTMMQRLEQVAQRLGSVEQTQGGAEKRATEVTQAIGDLQSLADGIKATVDQAVNLKQDLERIASPTGPVHDLRIKADDLRERFLNYSHDVLAVREQQEALKTAQQDAVSRYGDVRDGALHLKDEVGDAQTRLAQVEAGLAGLTKVHHAAEKTTQDVQMLNALADSVVQKTRALEKQRDTVERAAQQAERLNDLVWELDAKIKKLEQDSRLIKKTQDGLTDLQEVYRQVESRTGEIRASQQKTTVEAEAFGARLVTLRDEVKQTVARFELEKQGLDSVTQRTGDLRESIADFERRFTDLARASHAVAQAQSRGDELVNKLTQLTAEVGRVGEQAERAKALQAQLERAEASGAKLEERLTALSQMQPVVQQVTRDVTDLRAARDDVRDATAQLTAVRAEIERAQQRQAEAKGWLETADKTVADLRQQIGAVQALGASVEQVRVAAEQTSATVRDIEGRRDYVEQIERRLSLLGTLSGELDGRIKLLEERRAAVVELEGRSDAIRERLTDADRRFEAVQRRVDEIQRIEQRLAAMTAQVDGAEARMGGLTQGLADADARAKVLRELSAWMEKSGSDLEQRQRAVEQATQHLDRAVQVRQGAADTASALEEQVRRLQASLAAAETQTNTLAAFTEQVESKASAIRFAEKRIAQFEDKLANLERLQQGVEGAIAQVTQRQKSVEAVRDEVARVFETAERTIADMRDIAAGRPEVSAARQALEEVRDRARAVDELAASIDRRKESIQLAEQRMARLDALLIEIRASLEQLRAEKVMMDHVTEKASQLTFQSKAAEALIQQLREERDLTTRMRDVVSETRDEEKRAG
jgi:chromosome segregation ATPase